MVCDRCRMSVQQVLDQMKVPYKRVDLGEVEFDIEPDQKFLDQFRQTITPLGFELIEDRNSRIISQIKSAVIDLVRGKTSAQQKKVKLFEFSFGADCQRLPFTQQFVFGSRGNNYRTISYPAKDRVRERTLAYDELSLSQIADKLQYSSVQHLSNQFKKVTGLTPSHFKSIGHSRRQPLDRI